jgi:hypothetical protein
VGASATTGDYKAFIQKAGGELLGLNASSGTLTRIAFGNATAIFGSTQIIATGSDLAFITNSAEQMRLTSTGNLGLGVTPSAWNSIFKAQQIGKTAVVAGRTDTDQAQIQLGANFYYDATTYRYITSSFATLYLQNAGVHTWETAPSGTAGNAITFTQAMTLSAAGGLSVGTTTDAGAGNLLVAGNAAFGGGAVPVAPVASGFQYGVAVGAGPMIRSRVAGNDIRIGLTTNANLDGTYLVTTNNPVSAITLDNGDMLFQNAAGGSAGAAISYTTSMTLTSDGYLRMASGSGGIQFNGDTAAANALDDYEQGTWTPVLAGSTTAGTYTYETDRTGGRYVKIGKTVFLEGVIRVAGVTSAGTGDALVTGLPFVTTKTAPAWERIPGILQLEAGATYSGSSFFISSETNNSSSLIMRLQGLSTFTNISVTDADEVNGIWFFQLTYETA